MRLNDLLLYSIAHHKYLQQMSDCLLSHCFTFTLDHFYHHLIVDIVIVTERSDSRVITEETKHRLRAGPVTAADRCVTWQQALCLQINTLRCCHIHCKPSFTETHRYNND